MIAFLAICLGCFFLGVCFGALMFALAKTNDS